uniref:uncharacterized protein LOC122582879 n=1 Tax=Erigeron canadensis TaxID=72917 RepID=UPI001CB8C141|nr:uncharacterized protein LOC122582879 [Erigeron canadensis]
MSQRRKIENSITNNKPNIFLDFHNVANHVTKLYHQSINLQPISFNSGKRHSLTRVFDWISSHIKDGRSVTSADVMAYVQNELNESLSTNPHLQLEALDERSGSNHRGPSQDAHIEMNVASPSLTASTENRGPGENVPWDMEEDPPYV